jgi:hypothetical protein
MANNQIKKIKEDFTRKLLALYKMIGVMGREKPSTRGHRYHFPNRNEMSKVFSRGKGWSNLA